MQTIFSIIGPTATGKTAAAFYLAEYFLVQKFKNVHLISVDSRQAYMGLEILTGADVPDGFVQTESENFKYPYFEKGQIKLHGIGVIKPVDEWSVAHFQQLALPIIKNSENNHEAVILVGGTGLYHDHLFSNDIQLQIRPDLDFRTKAIDFSVEDLQSRLAEINPEKFRSLNNSDLNNPRRLIRAIEISRVKFELNQKPDKPPDQGANHLYIGITAPLDLISAKIKTRVKERFDQALGEVEIILGGEIGITKPIRTTLGFAQLAAYLNDQITKEQALEIWTTREIQYAKRQLTWWKKRPEVNWIIVETPDWSDKLIKMAKKLLAVKPGIA